MCLKISHFVCLFLCKNCLDPYPWLLTSLLCMSFFFSSQCVFVVV